MGFPILKFLIALRAAFAFSETFQRQLHLRGRDPSFVSFPLYRSDVRYVDIAARRKPMSFVQLATAAKSSIARKDFFLPITIGFPPQKVLVALDTGSGNLVLPTTECKSTACTMHRRYDQLVSTTAANVVRVDEPETKESQPDKEVLSLCFGRGRATGHIVADEVCLGETGTLCARTQFLAAFEESQTPFALLRYDGILGLGLPATSVTKRFNVLGNMAEKKIFSHDRFAIWLAGPHDEEPSEVTFGDLNPARLNSNVVWSKVDDYSSGYWQVKAEITINNESIGMPPKDVAIDTGTSLIAGPKVLIETLLGQLNIQTDCSNYGSLPLLGFKFGSTVLNLEPADYAGRSEDGSTCAPQFADIEMPNGIMLLGDPFLHKYYSIFDRDTLQVGLALAHHQQDLSETPSLDPKKLVVHL